MFTESGAQTSIRRTIDPKTLRRLKDAYRDCVRSVDKFMNQLMNDMDDETLIVFHSDHGEAFGEHGSFGHQSHLYEENIHVPLLVHGTDCDDTLDAPISTIKIPERLSRYAQEKTLNPSELTAEYVVSRTVDDSAITVRGDRWKYLQTEDEARLYDLANDGETVDVSQKHPSVFNALQTRSEEYLEALTATTESTEEVATDAAMEQHLRSLGYL